MSRIYLFLALIIAVSSMSSCVASRKYQEAVDQKNDAKEMAAKEKQARLDAEKTLKETEEELAELKIKYKEIKSDYDLLQTRYNQQQSLNKDLQESYDKLLALNEKLKDDASSRKRELAEELNAKRRELERRERELRELEEKLRRDRAEFEKMKEQLAGKDANIDKLEEYKRKLQEDLAAREKRVKELEAAIAARDAKNKALRDKLLKALKVFKDSGDLDVEMRDGKVYVSLSQKLLFSSGSARLDSRGKDALGKLSEVLNKNPDLSILVEGHTDSDGDAKMNWELSTERALAVSQVLIKSDVAPERITAAGRGEHAPKASNSTEEGKAINRRTEIILEPELDEIMNIFDEG